MKEITLPEMQSKFAELNVTKLEQIYYFFSQDITEFLAFVKDTDGYMQNAIPNELGGFHFHVKVEDMIVPAETKEIMNQIVVTYIVEISKLHKEKVMACINALPPGNTDPIPTGNVWCRGCKACSISLVKWV